MRISNNQNDIVNLIQKGRIEFLERITKKSVDKRDYSKIIQYLSSPTNHLSTQDTVKVNEYSLIDVRGLDNEELKKPSLQRCLIFIGKIHKIFKKISLKDSI